MAPNTLVISFETYHDIPRCAKVQDLLKYTYPGIDIPNMTSPILATLFGVPRVLVAGSVYDSAGKGQDATIADLWDHEWAMLCITASGQDITAPCVGRTFLWTEDSPTNPIVETYREEQIRSDIIRVRHYVGEELLLSKTDAGVTVSNISAACAYLFGNIHS
jgi:hypothetical protein